MRVYHHYNQFHDQFVQSWRRQKNFCQMYTSVLLCVRRNVCYWWFFCCISWSSTISQIPGICTYFNGHGDSASMCSVLFWLQKLFPITKHRSCVRWCAVLTLCQFCHLTPAWFGLEYWSWIISKGHIQDNSQGIYINEVRSPGQPKLKVRLQSEVYSAEGKLSCHFARSSLDFEPVTHGDLAH